MYSHQTSFDQELAFLQECVQQDEEVRRQNPDDSYFFGDFENVEPYADLLVREGRTREARTLRIEKDMREATQATWPLTRRISI